MINVAQAVVFGRQKWYFVAEPEYQAILDEATLLGYTKPTKKEQFYQNNMVKDLKIAGIWNRLDQLFNFYYTGNQPFGLINWIHPTKKLTADISVYFVNKDGVKSSAIGSNLLSNYNPSIELGNYKLGDASVGYVRGVDDIFASNSATSGVYSGSNEVRIRETLCRVHFQDAGTFVTIGSLVPKSNKFIVANKDGTNLKFFVNNTKLIDSSRNLSADVNYEINFLDNGSTSAIETLQLGFSGGKLTETQVGQFNTIWSNYKSSIL